jgi:redox-regulated HSP33 family molecular chaperone
MSVAKKYLLNNSVVVTVIDSKDVLYEAARLHKLKVLPAAALNRVVTVGVFLSRDLKSERDRLSIIVSGASENDRNEESVKIMVSAKREGVKGYIEEGRLLKTDKECGENIERLPLETDKECGKNERFPLKGGKECDKTNEDIDAEAAVGNAKRGKISENINRKINVEAAVGKTGYITVVKDLGLKEPYTGRSEIVKGDMSADFALYLTASEQKPSAVALGEYFDGRNILAAGGIFMQVLPDTDDFLITIIQDILRDFSDFGKILYELKTPDAIIDAYFGDFDIKEIEEFEPRFFCGCSDERTRNIIRLMGRREAYETLKEGGEIEVRCDFCGKIYRYGAEDVGEIFRG